MIMIMNNFLFFFFLSSSFIIWGAWTNFISTLSGLVLFLGSQGVFTLTFSFVNVDALLVERFVGVLSALDCFFG